MLYKAVRQHAEINGHIQGSEGNEYVIICRVEKVDDGKNTTEKCTEQPKLFHNYVNDEMDCNKHEIEKLWQGSCGDNSLKILGYNH